MQTFCAAVDTMKKSCKEYEQSLKKTLTDNAELKGKVDHMAKALDEMKQLFSTDAKCGICCTRSVDTALECGHTMCTVCSCRALRAERCPYCRKAVTEKMKLYF